MVAERAGVQRHTLYAHFPDERSLVLACSGLTMERDPLPDAGPWRNIKDRRERIRTGVRAIYGWYQRNADLAGCVLRDAEADPLTREIVALRWGPYVATYQTVLGAGLNARQRAMLGVALSFHTWRSLAAESGLKSETAADVMVKAIDSQ
jgi:AcrR family transcriptional regulator